MSIDFEKLREPFSETEIEYKPGRVDFAINGDPYMFLMPYVDARAVQKRLDDVLGPERWASRLVRLIDGTGFICELSLEVAPGKWVTKAAASDDTDFEKVKGGDSRSLVRAASAWGIGRHLYDEERIFAEFVPKGTRGARRVRHNNTDYYYLVPERAQAPVPAQQKSAPAAKSRPTAQSHASPFQSVSHKQMRIGNAQERNETFRQDRYEQPIAQAPARRQPVRNARRSDPSEYVVPFGSTQGKKLRDHSEEELRDLEDWLIRLHEPKGQARICKEKLESYLGRRLGA